MIRNRSVHGHAAFVLRCQSESSDVLVSRGQCTFQDNITSVRASVTTLRNASARWKPNFVREFNIHSTAATSMLRWTIASAISWVMSER
jgi:hypothetical protein